MLWTVRTDDNTKFFPLSVPGVGTKNVRENFGKAKSKTMSPLRKNGNFCGEYA